MPAELSEHRLGDLVRLQRERDLLERCYRLQGATDRLLLAHGQAPAGGLARIDRVLEREFGEVPAGLQLVVDGQRERLALDEDVPDVAALRLRRLLVLGLVVVVVLLRVAVGDLDVLRHALRDLLANELSANSVLDVLVGQALGLQLLLVKLVDLRLCLRLLPRRRPGAEVLLLDLIKARGDVLVADFDAEVFGLLRVLGALDEVLDDLRAHGAVGRAARLRERLVLSLVAALGLVERLVELVLRDRVAADHRDRVARHGFRRAAAAAAGRCECRHEGEDWNEAKKLHNVRRAKHGPKVRLLGAFRA